jgi:prevent-host-death family protein
MTKTTKIEKPTFVGLKEFRRDVSKYAKQAVNGTAKVVVTSHNKPLFVVTPFEDDVYTAAVLEAVAHAKADVAAGRVYTHDEVVAELDQ